MNPRKIKLLDCSDSDLNKEVETAFAESFQKHFYKKYGVHPKGVIKKAGDGQYTVHLYAGWLADSGITVDMEDNSIMSVVNEDVNEILNHIFPVNEKQLNNFRKDVFTFYKNSISDGLDITDSYIEDEKQTVQDVLNVVRITVKNPIQRSRYTTVFRKYFNEIDSILKEADKSIENIIRIEFEHEKKRFIEDADYEKAIAETIAFFENNSHRTITPISKTKTAKDAILLVHKVIKIKTGRASQYPYKSDTDYNEFIKSLYSMYGDKKPIDIGRRMEQKN